MITRIAPNADTVARGERDGTLTVCQITTSQIQWSQVAHSRPITVLEWSPDGAWLASGGRDGMVHLWQAANGMCSFSLLHGRAVQRLEWSPDSRSLCAASGQTVHLIRITPAETRTTS